MDCNIDINLIDIYCTAAGCGSIIAEGAQSQLRAFIIAERAQSQLRAFIIAERAQSQLRAFIIAERGSTTSPWSFIYVLTSTLLGLLTAISFSGSLLTFGSGR